MQGIEEIRRANDEAAAKAERDPERERTAELERQLAAEREARLRAEAACAALRDGLDEVRYLVCDGGCISHDEIMALIERLLSANQSGTEMLEAGRLAYRALQGMDRDCCFSRQMDGADEHDDDCPVGQALAVGGRWFRDTEQEEGAA